METRWQESSLKMLRDYLNCYKKSPQTLSIKKSSDEGGRGVRHFFLKKFVAI